MPVREFTASASKFSTATLPKITANDSICSDLYMSSKDVDSITLGSMENHLSFNGFDSFFDLCENIPGNIGLFNYNNTCFMNSVLQCLSHIDIFAKYFVTDIYKNDQKFLRSSGKKLGLNVGKAEVTDHLAELLKCLWLDTYDSDTSINFKASVEKCNEQYKGNLQHDAQEFLLWLLDRLNEDLILPSLTGTMRKVKLFKNIITGDGSRHQSVLKQASPDLSDRSITRTFQGLHHSSLTCPTCGCHSTTFDPYLCISLPLPMKCGRYVQVIVVSQKDPMTLRILGIFLSVCDTVRQLREAVAADMLINVKLIVLCKLTDDGFYVTYSDGQLLSDISECSGVYAVEMFNEVLPPPHTPMIQLLLLHVEKRCDWNQRFCPPEVIQVPREASMKYLQREILRNLGEAVKPEIMRHNLRSLFQLQMRDESTKQIYLPIDVDMPLYIETVDRCLALFSKDFGPQHLQLIVEWEPEIKAMVIKDDTEHIVRHESANSVHCGPSSHTSVSLDECFLLYTQEEKLTDEDAWWCPHCNSAQRGATKTLGLFSVPEVLLLHLKRFKQSGMQHNKLNVLVDFPLEGLNMTANLEQTDGDVIPDDILYDLMGVVNHYGTMTDGHYTAYCKNAVDGKWREFDDRHVTDIPPQSVVTQFAYILFYMRRSLVKSVNQQVFSGDHWLFLHCNLGSRLCPDSRSAGHSAVTGSKKASEPVSGAVADRPASFSKWADRAGQPVRRSLTPQIRRRHATSAPVSGDWCFRGDKAPAFIPSQIERASYPASSASGIDERLLDDCSGNFMPSEKEVPSPERRWKEQCLIENQGLKVRLPFSATDTSLILDGHSSSDAYSAVSHERCSEGTLNARHRPRVCCSGAGTVLDSSLSDVKRSNHVPALVTEAEQRFLDNADDCDCDSTRCSVRKSVSRRERSPCRADTRGNVRQSFIVTNCYSPSIQNVREHNANQHEVVENKSSLLVSQAQCCEDSLLRLSVDRRGAVAREEKFAISRPTSGKNAAVARGNMGTARQPQGYLISSLPVPHPPTDHNADSFDRRHLAEHFNTDTCCYSEVMISPSRLSSTNQQRHDCHSQSHVDDPICRQHSPTPDALRVPAYAREVSARSHTHETHYRSYRRPPPMFQHQRKYSAMNAVAVSLRESSV